MSKVIDEPRSGGGESRASWSFGRRVAPFLEVAIGECRLWLVLDAFGQAMYAGVSGAR